MRAMMLARANGIPLQKGVVSFDEYPKGPAATFWTEVFPHAVVGLQREEIL